MGNIFKKILVSVVLLTAPVCAIAQTVDTATVTGGQIIKTTANGADFVATVTGSATGSLTGDVLTLSYNQDILMSQPNNSAGDNFNTTGTLNIDFSVPSGTDDISTCTPTPPSGEDLCADPGLTPGLKNLISVVGNTATFTTTQTLNGNNDLEVSWRVTYTTAPGPGPGPSPGPSPEPRVVPTLPLAGLGIAILALSAAAWRRLGQRK